MTVSRHKSASGCASAESAPRPIRLHHEAQEQLVSGRGRDAQKQVAGEIEAARAAALRPVEFPINNAGGYRAAACST